MSNFRYVISLDLQADLVALYRDHLNSLPLSPFYGQLNEKLINIYVPPNIIAHESRFGTQPQHTSIIRQNFTAAIEQTEQGNTDQYRIKRYADLFERNGDLLKNIYIQGEPGMGKSTFAAKMSLDWCDVIESTATNIQPCEEQNSYDTVDCEKYFTDVKALEYFKYLFLVSLQHCNRNECDIEDIIRNLIVSDLNGRHRYTNGTFIEKVLSEEICLVIIDGLDEWNHSSRCCKKKHTAIPQRRTGRNCTFLTFTRPWKLSDLSQKELLIENLYDIKGVVSTSNLCQKYFENIEKQSRIRRSFHNFQADTLRLRELLEIPILATSICFLWLNKSKLPDSICGIYSSMLDMLGKKSESNDGNEDNIYQRDDKLPKCFKNLFWCKKNQPLLDSLGKLAFVTIHTDRKQTAVVFSEETVNTYLKQDEQKKALQTGIMTNDLVSQVNKRKCKYWFLHKTFHEYLAALFVATHQNEWNDLRNIIKFYAETTESVRSIKMFYLFLSGMNPSMASEFSKHICSITTREVNKLSNTTCAHVFSQNQSINIFSAIKDVQEVLFYGYTECKANGYENVYIDLRHVSDFSTEPVIGHLEKQGVINSLPACWNSDFYKKTMIKLVHNTLETVMLYNLWCICDQLFSSLNMLPNLKYLVLSREHISTPECVIRKQCTYVSSFHKHGSSSNTTITIDSSNLKYLQVVGIVCPMKFNLTSCLKLKSVQLLKCNIELFMAKIQLSHCDIEGHNFLSDTTAEVLKNSKSLELFKVDDCQNANAVIQSLSNKQCLQILVIQHLDLGDCDIRLSLPDSIRDVELEDVTMTSYSWIYLVHSIYPSSNINKCKLNECFLVRNKNTIRTLHVILSCSQITVNCDAWELRHQAVKICKYYILS